MFHLIWLDTGPSLQTNNSTFLWLNQVMIDWLCLNPKNFRWLWLGSQWCNRYRNLRERDFIKNPETETRDFKFETENRDFKICAFCRKFFIKCRLHFWVELFPNFWYFPHLFWLFLTCKVQVQQIKNRWIIDILLQAYHFFPICKISISEAFEIKTETRPETEMSGLSYYAIQILSWYLQTLFKSIYSPKYFSNAKSTSKISNNARFSQQNCLISFPFKLYAH